MLAAQHACLRTPHLQSCTPPAPARQWCQFGSSHLGLNACLLPPHRPQGNSAPGAHKHVHSATHVATWTHTTYHRHHMTQAPPPAATQRVHVPATDRQHSAVHNHPCTSALTPSDLPPARPWIIIARPPDGCPGRRPGHSARRVERCLATVAVPFLVAPLLRQQARRAPLWWSCSVPAATHARSETPPPACQAADHSAPPS